MNKPVCKYGASCYRKNPDHLKKFSHPRRDSEQEDRDTPPSAKKPKVDVDPLPQVPNEPEECKTELADQSESEGATEGEEDIRETCRKRFLVDLPEDFYLFWDFCKQLDPKSPTSALMSALGLRLVGPYDLLAGSLKVSSWEHCVLHSRHFYDPPEMTTVLGRGEGQGEGFHVGYFRDDPKTGHFLLVSNDSGQGCELTIEGGDVFSAVRSLIQSKLKGKEGGTETRPLQTLNRKLADWMSKNRASVCEKTVKELQSQRSKEVVARTFNKFGIVVPYDKKADLGYRPLPMTDRDLRRLMDKICSSTGDKRDQAFEPLQEVVTFVQFANDECDYGMGLELGLDLFCHGDPHFHTLCEHVLPLAYELLGRENYAQICRQHLKARNRTPL